MTAVNIPMNRYHEGVVMPIMDVFHAKLEIVLSEFSLKLPEVMDPFEITFEEYLKMDEEKVKNLQLRTLMEKEKWINKNIKEKGADWIVVCGGNIVKWSSDPEEYPTEDELKKIGKNYNRIPFVFSDAPLIEECGWSKTKNQDYYPSIEFSVTGGDKTLDIKGDFDTGSPDIFLDLNELISRNIVYINRFDYPNKKKHLGGDYIYYRKWVVVCINDEDGKTDSLKFNSYCVSDWQKSPFCLINPDRKALIGRNILFKFKLKIELDGKENVTKVYLST